MEVEVVEEFALRAKFPNRKWQSRMRGRASASEHVLSRQSVPNSQVHREREREREEMYGICNIMWNKKLAKMERRNAIN